MKSLEVINPKAAGIDVGSEKFFFSIAGDQPGGSSPPSPRMFFCCGTICCGGGSANGGDGGHGGLLASTSMKCWKRPRLEVVMVNGAGGAACAGAQDGHGRLPVDCYAARAWLVAGRVCAVGANPASAGLYATESRSCDGSGQPGAADAKGVGTRMNIKFHDVISDLTGVSGQKVLEAGSGGRTQQPGRLLELCDGQIKKKKKERVMESLRGTWRAEHLFVLSQAMAAWKFYQGLLEECDREVARVLQEVADQTPPAEPPDPTQAPVTESKRLSKNAPQIQDLHQLLKRVCGGRDVTAVAGIADGLLVHLVGETGTDMKAWATEKELAGWLGLNPEHGPRKWQTPTGGATALQPRRTAVSAGSPQSGPEY